MALPLLGSLLQTYGMVALLCRTPWGSTLTWPGLLGKAISYLLITMAAHVVAVWTNRKLFRNQIAAPAGFLILAIWPSVVWLPLLVLLMREGSVLMALLPPLIVGTAAVSLRRWIHGASGPESASREAGDLRSLFHVESPRSPVRAMAPAAATSLALQGAAAAFALGRPLAAGWLLAAGTVLPVWMYTMRLRPLRLEEDAMSSVRGLARPTLTVLLLLAIALMPYLRSGGGTLASIRALLRANASTTASMTPPKVRATGRAPDGTYRGVILVLPPKPHHELQPPPPPAASVEVSRFGRKPVMIPFDGAYWYFKQPDAGPKADAPVVRGDPRKKSIRSTDLRPLSMEAHQRLVLPVRMDCCRLLRLAIENADNEPGAISVEILLRDRASKEGITRSLGTAVIASSVDQHVSSTRPPVDEVLSFRFPQRASGEEFDEITVVIKPAKERARTGARVAVQTFELVP